MIRDANAVAHNESDDESNYLAYATCPLLLNKWRDDPNVFNKLVDEIVTDLEFSYEYSSDAFPEKPEQENRSQRDQRMAMVEEWMNTRQ